MEYLIFSIDNQEFGVFLESVKRVVWSAAVTSICSQSENLLGMINIKGKILPVLNTRISLGLRNKEIALSDQFIVCQFPSLEALLWVDEVLEIGRFNEEEECKSIDLPLACSGIVSALKREDKLIFVYDWEFLVSHFSPDELMRREGQRGEK